MRRTTKRIAIPLLAGVAGIASCGGGDDPSPVAAAIERAQDAFADGDVRDACAQVTTATGRHVGRAGHDPPKGCVPDLAGLAKMFDQAEQRLERADRPSHDPPAVQEPRIAGRRATAMVTLGESRARMPLAREGGAWKLDALYGGQPASRQLRKRPWVATVPAAAGGGVGVTRRVGGKAEPCPPLRGLDTPRPRGGCTIRANSSDIDVFVLTALREFRFGNCYFSFTMRVDAHGRVGIERAGMGGDSPCNKTPACFTSDPGRPLPWRGTIGLARDGTPRALLDSCFDTCLGRFEGGLDLALRQGADGWLARADHATVGVSGWKLDGDLELEADGIEIAPRAGA